MIEETKEAGEGVEFLTGSRGDWSDTVYNNHLTWHLTLYHLGGCGSVTLVGVATLVVCVRLCICANVRKIHVEFVMICQ